MSTVLPRSAELAADQPASGALGLAESGLIPDALVRLGIRWLCTDRLRTERRGGPGVHAERFAEHIGALRRIPVATHTQAASAQHYELPSAFFASCLGPRPKYSCCCFSDRGETLAQAEEAILERYAQRAALADGQQILELGCGWGWLTLWMAERSPRAHITAVSKSYGRSVHIEAQCRKHALANMQVLTRDVNSSNLDAASFDRCVSVEMSEHLRNYETLMRRIALWLKPGGKLFCHLFAHRTLMYPFETVGAGNWMGRHFFTDDLMPAADALLHFQSNLTLERRWVVDGTHYRRTAALWLSSQNQRREQVLAVLREAYGASVRLWFERWRIFWTACAELFGYAYGTEWLVVHCRFGRAADGLGT